MENKAKTNRAGERSNLEEMRLCREKKTKNRQKFVINILRDITVSMKQQNATKKTQKREMKNSTGGLENKDEEISQKVEQNEKHGKYEKKDREPVQEAQHSERMNRENKRGNHQQNNSRKVPRTKVVRLKGVTKCPKQ